MFYLRLNQQNIVTVHTAPCDIAVRRSRHIFEVRLDHITEYTANKICSETNRLMAPLALYEGPEPLDIFRGRIKVFLGSISATVSVFYHPKLVISDVLVDFNALLRELHFLMPDTANFTPPERSYIYMSRDGLFRRMPAVLPPFIPEIQPYWDSGNRPIIIRNHTEDEVNSVCDRLRSRHRSELRSYWDDPDRWWKHLSMKYDQIAYEMGVAGRRLGKAVLLPSHPTPIVEGPRFDPLYRLISRVGESVPSRLYVGRGENATVRLLSDTSPLSGAIGRITSGMGFFESATSAAGRVMSEAAVRAIFEPQIPENVTITGVNVHSAATAPVADDDEELDDEIEEEEETFPTYSATIGTTTSSSVNFTIPASSISVRTRDLLTGIHDEIDDTSPFYVRYQGRPYLLNENFSEPFLRHAMRVRSHNYGWVTPIRGALNLTCWHCRNLSSCDGCEGCLLTAGSYQFVCPHCLANSGSEVEYAMLRGCPHGFTDNVNNWSSFRRAFMAWLEEGTDSRRRSIRRHGLDAPQRATHENGWINQRIRADMGATYSGSSSYYANLRDQWGVWATWESFRDNNPDGQNFSRNSAIRMHFDETFNEPVTPQEDESFAQATGPRLMSMIDPTRPL